MRDNLVAKLHCSSAIAGSRYEYKHWNPITLNCLHEFLFVKV